MQEIITKKRDTNFELLRIAAMLMIVTLHFNGHGQVLSTVPLYSKSYYLAYFAEYACIIAVNLYVMITGYYMIKSKIKIKKIILLELQILFYTLGIYLILVMLKQAEFNTKTFIQMFLPITTNQYWFMTAYMGLYILIPFINKLANSLSKKQYIILLVIMTIFISVIRTIYPKNCIFEARNGYGLSWFIYLYLLTGYIRLYCNKNIKKGRLVLIYVSTIVVQILLRTVNQKYNLQSYIDFSLAYNSSFILIETLAMFFIFKSINIKNSLANKIILAISPLVLGVYLIQEHNSFRDILWNKILTPSAYVGGLKLIVAWFIEIVVVFTLSCIIEKARRTLFKIISKAKPINKISSKINELDKKIMA